MKRKKDKKIADPKSPNTKAQYIKLIKTGKSLYKKGDYINAIQFLNKSFDYDNSNPNVLILLAESLFRIDKKSAALEILTYALESNPTDPGIVSSLGNAAVEMNFFDLAQSFHKIYISLVPNDTVGYNNYATALREDGKYEEAINLLKDVLPIFPKAEELWNTLGSVVSFHEGPRAAIIFYEECLKINPQNSQALNNIAPAYYSIKEYKKAEDAIRLSIKLSPKTKYQHMFLSSLLLQDQRLTEGWEEYKWSHYGNNFNLTVKSNNIPYWNGECLKGKKIFVYGEQGIGDEILFTWQYKNLIKDAEKVGISCQSRLVPLFRNSFPKAQVDQYYFKVNRELDIEYMYFPDFDLSEYDYQIIAGEVATHYWKDYKDIKAINGPVLSPSKEKIAIWKKRIEDLPNDISVGIAWRSGLMLANRSQNYADLMEWTPILKEKDINFVNVQYGDCQKELDDFEDKTGIKIYNFEDLNLKDDFESTTAMMQNLDLVIGPASAPLMQSALSDIETWFFVSRIPFWTFGDETPKWQPKVKVFAKDENETWAPLMKASSKQFKIWIKSKT